MTFEELLLMLMVIALALGFGACAALLVRNHRIADALFVSALVVGGAMLIASLSSVYAFSATSGVRVEHAAAAIRSLRLPPH